MGKLYMSCIEGFHSSVFYGATIKAPKMKTIGLIGGMSWESTSSYYSLINRTVNERLGKNHSASCLIYSFNFQEIEDLQYAGKWDELEARMLYAADALKKAGADGIAVCTNTMHKVVDHIEELTGLPLLHIADAVGEEIVRHRDKTVGLLGTKFTMEEDFYRSRLEQKYGLTVVVPERDERLKINQIIYEELVKGIIKGESRNTYIEIMDKMKKESGMEGVVLGCTEIGLLVKEYDRYLYDSTIIHAKKIVDFCLGTEN